MHAAHLAVASDGGGSLVFSSCLALLLSAVAALRIALSPRMRQYKADEMMAVDELADCVCA